MSKSTWKYILIEDLPKRQSKWFQLFEDIPKGKALVLDSSEFNARAIRAALHHHQKRKEQFKNYYVLVRQKKIYVVHPTDEKVEST